jgi:hypothetical protein
MYLLICCLFNDTDGNSDIMESKCWRQWLMSRRARRDKTSWLNAELACKGWTTETWVRIIGITTKIRIQYRSRNISRLWPGNCDFTQLSVRINYLPVQIPGETIILLSIKGKAVTDLGGPKGCVTSRLQYLIDNRFTGDGDVVSITRRPPFPTGRFLVLISVRGWVNSRAIVRLEELGQLRNAMISSGIETATF